MAAVPEAKSPPEESSEDPVMVVPVIPCAASAPEMVVEAPFKMATPEIYRKVEVAFVVVPFVPEKFCTLSNVDEAVDWKPL